MELIAYIIVSFIVMFLVGYGVYRDMKGEAK